MATYSVASQSSQYLQSLVDYVLDVKPYHTKVSQSGAVSESYIFSDAINVSLTENNVARTYLGADLMPDSFTLLGVRERETYSWWQELVSDGVRLSWPMPLFSNPKFASQARLEKFVNAPDTLALHNSEFATGQLQEIPGLTSGVFNQKRWDGPGITDVRLNDTHLQDTIDYTLSHGVFTFDILNAGATMQWIRHDLNTDWNVEIGYDGLPAPPPMNPFGGNDGSLIYKDVVSQSGMLIDVTGETFEEFKAVCTFGTDSIGYVEGSTPTVLTIYAASDDFTAPLGTVNFGDTFTLTSGPDTRIEFTFTFAPGETQETALVDDEWLISPFNRITIAPGATEETWSLIKSNPIRLVGAPLFNGNPMVAGGPAIEIHTRSIELTPASTWSLTFVGDGTYTLNSSLPGYPKTISLIDGCSYKSVIDVGASEYIDIAFTIIPTVDGWAAGDVFTWEIGADEAHYKVFGSVSGWQADATVGEWYWNGSIGFKIPKLDYFTQASTSTIAVSEDDGTTWNIAISNPQVLKSVIFSNGAFFTTGSDSVVAASSDGYTWTSDVQSLFVPNPNEVLVIQGEAGVVAVSEDGDTWVIETTNVIYDLHSSTMIPDFLSSTILGPNDLNCIIVVGDGGTIITSTNGTGWAIQNSGTTLNLNSVTWSDDGAIGPDDGIIAVGVNGTILRSTDRITWTPIVSNTTEDLRCVIYEPTSNAFIAVGDGGTIIRSTDKGLTWVNLGIFADGDFSSVAYGDGTFIAVGPSGYIATSTDGVAWTRVAGRPFNSIAYGPPGPGGKFVAVGGTLNLQVPFTPANIRTHALTGPRREPSAMLEPSVYTITFTKGSDTGLGVPAQGKVFNSIHGYGPNLTTGEVWTDGFTAFQIDTILDELEFNPGDTVAVYIAPNLDVTVDAGYDAFPYDSMRYDANNTNVTVPWLYSSELYPLYHAHGAVIIPSAANNDDVIIDKAFLDRVKFRIVGATANFPELGAVGDWLPLFFKYSDNVDSNLVSTSVADFSDLGMFVEAFSAATGQRVFKIISPRFNKTNRASMTTLVLDEDFFADYMPFNTRYSILVEPDQTYGQTIRVKVTEELKVFARVNLIFDEIMPIVISEDPVQWFITGGSIMFTDLMNVEFIEGGALPVAGYDYLGYDDFPYDFSAAVVLGGNNEPHYVPALLVGWVETSPGVFTYTGDNNDWVIPNGTPGTTFGTSVSEEPANVVGSSMTEGLSIVMQEVIAGALPVGTRHITVIYDFALADQAQPGYLFNKKGVSIDLPFPITANDVLSVKMLNVPGMPDEWFLATQAAPGVSIKSDYVVLTRTEIDFGIVITDPNSFDADLSGIPAPGLFRLWITTL